MNHLLESLGDLLLYPDHLYVQRLDEALKATAPEDCRAPLERFQKQASGLSVGELQELYTRTFDLSPLCSLEVGWQLYGEDYARGSFLVYMRSLLVQHSLSERGELPDHLANLLAVIAQMPTDQAEELREGAAVPAVKKMLEALAKNANPYIDLVRAVSSLLEIPVDEPARELSHV